MSEFLDKLKRVILDPETPDEKLLHEVAEFIIYGFMFKKLSEALQDDDS